MEPHYRRQIEQLYIELYDKLKAYARANLGNESLAEEAVQETFRIACQKPAAVCESENPQGWIVIALKNTIRNMKTNLATTQRIMDQFLLPKFEQEAYTEDPANLQLLYGSIAKTKEFQLLAEMVLGGRSHEEMAADRGITVDACKKRVQRAKEYLRRKIK